MLTASFGNRPFKCGVYKCVDRHRDTISRLSNKRAGIYRSISDTVFIYDIAAVIPLQYRSRSRLQDRAVFSRRDIIICINCKKKEKDSP